jgi:integrase/recombinase XerD
MNTLLELTEDLYARYRGLRSSPHTLARLRLALRIFLEYLDQERDVSTPEALTLEHLHAFQAHLGARTARSGLPHKPSAVNTIVKGVRVFLNLLYERGLLRRPLAGALRYVKLPDLLPSSVLTHAQVKQVMRQIPTGTPVGIRDRAALELLYSSGLRIGELESLRLADLDLDRGVARVIGKGRKERYVPIGKTAIKWLTTYIRGIRPFSSPGSQSDAVFLNPAGRPLSQHTLRERVREYARQLGLEIHVTPHTFRRSCTSELIKSNANLYHVKQLLGHKSFETLNHYVKLDIADLRKTHEKCHPREHDQP